MKSKLILGLLSLFMVFSMTSCMEKVDAGCEGIKVNLYGSDKVLNGTILGLPQYMSILLMYRLLTMNHLQSMQRMVQSSL